MGRHIRRLGSDPNLTCPSLKRLTSHMGLLTHTFHPPYGNGMVRNLTIFFQNILFALSLSYLELHTSLIHKFLCFTTEEIIGISEEWPQHHLSMP